MLHSLHFLFFSPSFFSILRLLLLRIRYQKVHPLYEAPLRILQNTQYLGHHRPYTMVTGHLSVAVKDAG